MPATHPWLPLEVPGPHHTIAQRLTEVASAIPDHIALASPGESYTFADVDALTEALTDLVRSRLDSVRLPTDEPIGLIAPGSASALMMFLALTRAGRTVVLLDTHLPTERLSLILKQAGVSCCVGDRNSEWADVVPAASFFDLAELLREADQRATNPRDHDSAVNDTAAPDDVPACVVFTSGSTGSPKGVTYPHRTLLNEAYAARTRLDVEPNDRTALILPFAFAAGLAVMVMALLNGAGLYVYDPRDRGIRGLPDFMREHEVTTVHATPSLMRSLLGVLAPGEILDQVRLVTTCGEAVYGRDVNAIRAHLADTATFTSWSGSSETGHLAFYRIGPGTPVPDGVIPVGEPAPNKTVELWGENQKPVPHGETGEVVITSPYLTDGYWNNDAATQNRFEFLPDNQICYRMGDLARFDQQGLLHLLGRNDSAVKVRGYLVEPAEIEAALLAEDDIAEAVVAPLDRPPSATQLIAYVAPSPHHRTPSRAQLRRRLRQRLPEWMMPSYIVQLDSLPRNERGKIDRPGLPPVPQRSEPKPPRYEWEVILADLWSNILELDTVGRDESFGELGGDSLGAEEVLTQVQERFGVALTAGQFATVANLAEFAALVAEAASGSAQAKAPNADHQTRQPAIAKRPSQVPKRYRDTVIGLQERGDRPALFCFTGAGAGALSFSSMARHLGGEQPLYALQPHGLERRAIPSWTVASAARRHLKALRSVQPNGPYLLVGHSLGGLVAIAAARHLAATGEDVPLVAIIDAFLPRSVRRQRPTKALELDRPLIPQPDPLPQTELWRRRLRLPLAGLLNSDPHTQSGNLEELGRRMVEFHRPQPWSGPAIVYQSYENPDPPALWEHVLTGSTQMRTVASDHASIVREPHVQQLAADLTDDIASALSTREVA